MALIIQVQASLQLPTIPLLAHTHWQESAAHNVRKHQCINSTAGYVHATDLISNGGQVHDCVLYALSAKLIPQPMWYWATDMRESPARSILEPCWS